MNRFKKLLFIILLACIIIVQNLYADGIITLKDDKEIYPIGIYLDILEDKEKKWTFEDILSEEISKKFIKNSKETPNFGYTDSAFWIRFKIKSISQNHTHWLLEYSYPLMDKIELYKPLSNNKYIKIETGYMMPFSEREILHRNFIFNFDPTYKEIKTYYLRFENRNRIVLPLKIFSLKAFQQNDHNEQYIMGIFLGILFFMFLFNLLLFISIKDRTYIYYVLFVATYTFFQLIQNGLAYEYFWPKMLEAYNHAVPLSISLVLLSIVQFSQAYLDIEKKFKNSNRFISIYKILLIISIFVPLIASYSLSLKIMIVMAIIILSYLFYFGTIELIKGYRPAKFYMLGWSTFLLGGIIYGFMAWGILVSNFFTYYAIQITVVIQFFLLSFGLGDRINLMKREKEHAQAEAIEAHEIAIQNLKESAKQKDDFLEKISKINKEIEALNINLQQKIIDLDNANKIITLSEEKYKLLVEGSNDIIFSLDENLRFVTVNQAIKKHFMISPESVKNQSILDLIYIDLNRGSVTKHLVQEKLDNFLESRKPINFRAEFKSPISSEPKEMHVRLEYINIEGKNEILGKASSVEEDILMKYFIYENQAFQIGNFFITAEDISHRITRNLCKYVDAKQINLIRIALREIIINAIEHGNLDITYNEKTDAMVNENYFALVAQRQHDPQYSSKQVKIDYSIHSDKAVYKISDEGKGFDYNKIITGDLTETNESMLSHGRGIFMAKSIFDQILFNEKGNEVTLIKNFTL